MLFIWIILFICIATFAYGSFRAAPWVPTWKGDVERFLRLAAIQPGERVYDLGCGDGRLICAAAKAGAQAQGFEVALIPYLLARIRIAHMRLGKICKLRYKDFWFADLRDADVVYFFLMPDIFPKLKVKFERELKKGTRVISYVWPIKGWEPCSVDVKERKPNLYLYQL